MKTYYNACIIACLSKYWSHDTVFSKFLLKQNSSLFNQEQFLFAIGFKVQYVVCIIDFYPLKLYKENFFS